MNTDPAIEEDILLKLPGAVYYSDYHNSTDGSIQLSSFMLKFHKKRRRVALLTVNRVWTVIFDKISQIFLFLLTLVIQKS